MSSKVLYEMHGFNQDYFIGSCKKKSIIDSDIEWNYRNHPFLQTVHISKELRCMEFVLQEGKEAKDYLNDIGDELERICFNIIAHTEIPTIQPFCERKQIINSDGTIIMLEDRIKFYDEMTICNEYCADDLAKTIMEIETPISDKKAEYKELFFILHNPHRVIQFIALYDILQGKICNDDDRMRQEKVTNFFGKNRTRYPFAKFVPRNDNPDKNEDTFTHIRNSIAHSKQAGIDKYIKTTEFISDEIISQLLTVISDIISGKVSVK